MSNNTKDEVRRWQHFQMDKMQMMLPVGTQPASGSVMCHPTGDVYVLASDYDDMCAMAMAAVWLIPPDKMVGELRQLHERIKSLMAGQQSSATQSQEK